MKSLAPTFLFFALLGLSACGSMPEHGRSMVLSEAVSAPIGHRSFCKLYPEECAPIEENTQTVRLTHGLWQQLQDVQRAAQIDIEPVADKILYGSREHWAYPENGQGDCEDFALDKYRRLRALGWHRSALRIATAVTGPGNFHAVLVAITDHGDFILDNRFRRVLSWENANYQWRKRQSQTNGAEWVRIEIAETGPSPTPELAMAAAVATVAPARRYAY